MDDAVMHRAAHNGASVRTVRCPVYDRTLGVGCVARVRIIWKLSLTAALHAMSAFHALSRATSCLCRTCTARQSFVCKTKPVQRCGVLPPRRTLIRRYAPPSPDGRRKRLVVQLAAATSVRLPVVEETLTSPSNSHTPSPTTWRRLRRTAPARAHAHRHLRSPRPRRRRTWGARHWHRA